MFPLEFLGVKTYRAQSAQNLGVILETILTFVLIYLRFAAHVFTTFEICSVFAVTLFGIVQNCMQMHWCLVVLISVIHVCLVSQIQRVHNRLVCVVTKSPPFTRTVLL